MLSEADQRIPVYRCTSPSWWSSGLATSANWISSKPRFLLPAVLPALPVPAAGPARTSVLVPLIGVLERDTWAPT